MGLPLHTMFANINSSRVRYIAPQDDSFIEEQIIIMSPYVAGFSFTPPRWGCFSVAALQTYYPDENAFDKVVLAQSVKEIIKGLVKEHKRSEGEQFQDLIRGKGQGTAILLAGETGCGKTLTVETLAMHVRRPLYSISAGELGIKPSDLETKLREVFDNASTWGAVLLIDEADFLLTERTSDDLGRSSLVSVFLRSMEYYRGVLILTTNRSDHLDPSIRSRIHFVHKFNPLDIKARKQIFELYISKYGGTAKEADLDTWSRYSFNGREVSYRLRLRRFTPHTIRSEIRSGWPHSRQTSTVNLYRGIISTQ